VYPPFDLAQHVTWPVYYIADRKLFGQSYYLPPTTTYPMTFTLANPTDKPYVLEARSVRGELYAPFTDAPEAVFLRRRNFENGCMRGPLMNEALARQLFYMSPVPQNDATIRFSIQGSNGKYDGYPASAGPVFYHIETESGGLIAAGNLFLYGRRHEAIIDLAASGSPPPVWLLYTTAQHGPRFRILSGDEELLLSVNKQHLRTIQGMLPVFKASDPPCP
jgi:hypothetical protein